MKDNFIHIVMFLFMTQMGIAQEDFTASQLQNFVDIYMDSKKNKAVSAYELVTSKKLEEHGISHARYREIFRSNISKEEIKLSENEISFFNEIQKTDDNFKKEKNGELISDCTSRSIKYETYQEINNKYNSDINFQRSLKPYFDHYLNDQK